MGKINLVGFLILFFTVSAMCQVRFSKEVNTQYNPGILVPAIQKLATTSNVDNTDQAALNNEFKNAITLSTNGNTLDIEFSSGDVLYGRNMELVIKDSSNNTVYSNNLSTNLPTSFDISNLPIGSYEVLLSENSTSTTASATITVERSTGISELANNSVQVFPNPADDYIQVQYQNTTKYRSQPFAYRIFDAKGNKVLEGEGLITEDIYMDVSPLPSGNYTLSLRSKAFYTEKRFTISR